MTRKNKFQWKCNYFLTNEFVKFAHISRYENLKRQCKCNVGDKRDQQNDYKKQDVGKLQCQKMTEYCGESPKTETSHPYIMNAETIDLLVFFFFFFLNFVH